MGKLHQETAAALAALIYHLDAEGLGDFVSDAARKILARNHYPPNWILAQQKK